MCGILGAIALDGAPPPEAALGRALDLLGHRGPDDAGVASEGPVVFGHRRLSIIAPTLATAHQPLVEGGRMLTFNGEIYNFKDLAERLPGMADAQSDTRVLAAALGHWGVEKTLAEIDGMFAFGHYDVAGRTLCLARDRLGEKPVYWTFDGRTLWFSSEIKSLIAAGAASTAPNLARIDDYLYTAKFNGAATAFRDVHELEPGTFLTISLAAPEPRIATYWGPESAFARLRDHGPVQTDAEEFGRRFDAAVRSRLMSDVPIGFLLSGGIDSNALTEAAAAAIGSGTVNLYFADNKTPSASERADVDIFLDHLRRRYPAIDFRLHSVLVDLDDYMAELRDLTWYYDEPIQFANSPLLGHLARKARADGLKVLLSGEGSDELLYGYDRFVRTEDLLRDETDRDTRIGHLYFGGGWHTHDEVAAITRGVAEGAAATEPWRYLAAHIDEPLPLLQTVFSERYRLQTLMQRQDRIGMRYSIEIRVPFLQPSFVDWVNDLDQSLKCDPATRTRKAILREAMANRLPERILTKPKSGFPSDMLTWIGERDLEPTVRDVVQASGSISSTALDRDLVARLLDRHFDGTARRDVLVWNLLALEIWHATFQDFAAEAARRC